MKTIITTHEDLSSDYFRSHGWDVHYYDSDSDSLAQYNLVYPRDPFNDPSISASVETLVDQAFRKVAGARLIDGLTSFAELRQFEDKYHQFTLYEELMPKTYLPSEVAFESGKHLAKKRISQRAKDILFSLDQPLSDDWIIQELLDIKEELRVYIVFGQVVPQATIKTSKSSGKVKIVGGRQLSNKELDFCRAVAERTSLDFVGLDLAILADGKMKLIEVNRSPQFKRFAELYGEQYLSGILDL